MRRMLVIVALLNALVGGLSMLTRAPASQTWPTHTVAEAAYRFAYPPDASIETSIDASLRYPIVYVRFPLTNTAAYQGASIMVLEDVPAVTRRVPQAANGRVQLQRDADIGDLDARTVLIPGDGVVYRINLFGGGKGGQIDPPPAAVEIYDRLVESFAVLAQPLQPQARLPLRQPGAADASLATTFTWPLRDADGVNYGVPVGFSRNNTRMEWLDYAIRNLDQWRNKCYGVDWSRMLHTGEDWYRLDFLTANSAGTPVYAVADGVVVRHNPGLSYPGNVVLIQHRLADGRSIYSMYGHITNVRVTQGQTVARGEQIATIFNQGYVGRTPGLHPTWDSHLHFEMRWFLDGSNIYTPGTNAYGYNYPGCTWLYPGRGYTYVVHPDQYPYPGAGYVDPSDFIAARLEDPAACVPAALISNGGFESGLPGRPWRAANSLGKADPLIYKNRPRTGAWGSWLGNVLSYTDTLAQPVALGGVTGTLTLGFWRYVQSAEPSGNGDDQMQAVLSGPDGQPLGAITISSAVTRGVWARASVQVELRDSAPLTGLLTLRGRNDADNISSFFVDDVTLDRTCVPTAQIAAGQQTMQLSPTVPITAGVYLPAVLSERPEPDKSATALSCRDIAINGSFEGNTAWVGIANTGNTIYTERVYAAARARSGLQSGQVGTRAANGYWNEVLQTVQLPANTVSATLTFWRYLDTDEAAGSALDRFSAGLETERGIEIHAPLRINSASAGRGQWVEERVSIGGVQPYAGTNVWVSFKGATDSTRPSSLYLDDVTLTVCQIE
jgi:murein DD-endopeptidase MepM/ murein hydrolase activator NlpD